MRRRLQALNFLQKSGQERRSSCGQYVVVGPRFHSPVFEISFRDCVSYHHARARQRGPYWQRLCSDYQVRYLRGMNGKGGITGEFAVGQRDVMDMIFPVVDGSIADRVGWNQQTDGSSGSGHHAR